MERDATEQDSEELYRLHVASMKEYITATYGWNDAEQERLWRERWPDTFREMRLLIEASGEISAAWRIERRSSEIFLASIEVAPRHQRQGIGARIINRLIAEAAGCHRVVSLTVMKANPQAKSLYERLGFRVVSQTPTHYRMVIDS